MTRILVVALFALALSPAISAPPSTSDLLSDVQARIAAISPPASKGEAVELKSLLAAEAVLSDGLDLGASIPPSLAFASAFLGVADLFAQAAKAIEKSGTADAGILSTVDSLRIWFNNFGGWLSSGLEDLEPSLSPEDLARMLAAEKKASDQAVAASMRWDAGALGAGSKGYLKALKSLVKLLAKYS